MNDNRTSSTPKSSGSNPGQRPGRSNNRRGRGNKKWNRNKHNKSGFVRKTKEMNRHVFQLQGEQRKSDNIKRSWSNSKSMHPIYI